LREGKRGEVEGEGRGEGERIPSRLLTDHGAQCGPQSHTTEIMT